MNKEYSIKEVLSFATKTCAAKGMARYTTLSKNEQNTIILERVNYLLAPQKELLAKKFIEFVEQNDKALLNCDTDDFTLAQKGAVSLVRSVYHVILPLCNFHDGYLHSDLGEGWGEASINNDKAIRFIKHSKYIYLNYRLADKIANYMAFRFMEENNSTLYMQVIRTCADVAAEMEKRVPALDAATIINTLQGIENHREIGRRLGMDEYALRLYDVLREAYSECFIPKYVDYAIELAEWTYHSHPSPLPPKAEFAYQLIRKASALRVKYGIEEDLEEDTYSLLINELIMDLYPEDDDIEIDELDDSVWDDMED